MHPQGPFLADSGCGKTSSFLYTHWLSLQEAVERQFRVMRSRERFHAMESYLSRSSPHTANGPREGDYRCCRRKRDATRNTLAAPEPAGTSPSRRNRTHSSRRAWVAEAPCSCRIRRRTGRRWSAWSPAGHGHSGGTSTRTPARRYSRFPLPGGLDAQPYLTLVGKVANKMNGACLADVELGRQGRCIGFALVVQHGERFTFQAFHPLAE